MANNGIYYSSGHSLSFTTSGITWATLTSGGTFNDIIVKDIFEKGDVVYEYFDGGAVVYDYEEIKQAAFKDGFTVFDNALSTFSVLYI